MLLLGYIICISFGLSYLLLIKKYLFHWHSIPEFSLDKAFIEFPFISIIVAARNEENNISTCLQSLIEQDYPKDKYEIIVVDDHSTDKTIEEVKKIQEKNKRIHLISMSNDGEKKGVVSYKREAIQAGMALSKGDFLLLTDADCEVSTDWVKLISFLFIKEKCVFVGGPVVISLKTTRLLPTFQALDMIGMMIITGAGFHSGNQLLANGANMAFSKQAFHDAGGFSKFPAKASGDDMFLLHQMNKYYPGNIRFLKTLGGVVKTKPMTTITGFIQQRIRWASKNRNYNEVKISLSLLLIFLLSTFIILLGLLSFIKFTLFFPFFVILYLSKFYGDYLLQREAITFFKESRLSKYVFASQQLHTLYIFILGIMGNVVPRYQWKGRMVK